MKDSRRITTLLRSVLALARLTMVELLRRGLVPFSFVVLGVVIGVLDEPISMEEEAARARYLDLAFSVLAAGLVLVAAISGVQLSSDRDREKTGDGMALMRLGAAPHFIGRSLGLFSVLAVLGMSLGFVVVINVGIRFGDIAGEKRPVREVFEAKNFRNDREVKRSRRDHAEAHLEFDIKNDNDLSELELRFLPSLVLTGSPAELRGSCPVAFRLSDRHGSWKKRRVFAIHEGKALRFALDLPKGLEELDVDVENLSPSWTMRIDHRAGIVLGEAKSLAASILRGGLILGLFAAVFGLLALYFRTIVGPGSAVLLSLALAITSSSLDLMEEGVLGAAGDGLRSALSVTFATLLPDFDNFDVSAMLVRGIAVTWSPVLDLLLRLGITLTLLRFVLRRRS